MKESFRAAYDEEEADDLSGYYLALEIKHAHEGMMIALPTERLVMLESESGRRRW